MATETKRSNVRQPAAEAEEERAGGAGGLIIMGVALGAVLGLMWYAGRRLEAVQAAAHERANEELHTHLRLVREMYGNIPEEMLAKLAEDLRPPAAAEAVIPQRGPERPAKPPVAPRARSPKAAPPPAAVTPQAAPAVQIPPPVNGSLEDMQAAQAELLAQAGRLPGEVPLVNFTPAGEEVPAK